ncbi:MAG: DNRLRE domain-containing protein [Spirochaetes bacterium]|nr:DNRLRE domain-containing protein [Spirochaetota bacterium]
MIRKTMILLTIALITVLSCAPASDEETVLDGEPVFVENFKYGHYPTSSYTSTYDTYIASAAPANNYGAISSFYITNAIGYTRGLVRFIITGYFPANINVKKATLTLYTDGIGSPIKVSFHELTRSWIETQATWNEAETGTPWATIDGGGDFGPSVASYTVYEFSAYGFVSFNLPGSLVKKWITNPNENYGILIKVSSESGDPKLISFSSSEDTVSYRPMLTVYYTY